MARLGFLITGLAVSAVAASIQPAECHGQGYPARPVRMVVGFAPGGSTDAIARLINRPLSERLGQQVVVENRPGAAGNIAAEQVSRAPADGYTLYMASMSHTINASLYPKLSFDALRDFTPIAQVSASPFVLVVHKSVPAETTRALIALARAQPKALSFASGGASSHLAGELFNIMAGVKLLHIPYRSSGPAATDLLGGQVALMFSAPPAVLPHVASGRLRALGVTGSSRLPRAPEVPTIAESGLPGYEVTSWSGVMAPSGLAEPIVAKLHDVLAQVMVAPEVTKRLPAMGLQASLLPPQQFTARLQAEIEKWAKVVRESGIGKTS